MDAALISRIPSVGDLLRVAGAALWLLLPGFALIRRLRSAPENVAGRIATGTACALAASLLLSAITGLVGAPFDVLYIALWLLFGGSVALLLRAPSAFQRSWRPSRGVMWLFGAVALAFLVGVVTTRPISVAADAIDHIGTVRAIQERGEIDPNTVFYAAGDGATPDVRKGYGHALIAALSRTAGLDAARTWYALRPFLFAGALVAFAALARALTTGTFALVASLVAFPFVVHGNAVWFLDTLLYPHNANWLLIWPALALVVDEIRAPSWWRLATIALIALGSPALHVFAPVLLVAGVACISAACIVLAAPDARPGALRVLAITTVAALPLLLARIVMTYHPVNPLHVEASEVLYITSFLALHSPTPMLHRFSLVALLVALLGLLLLRRGASVPLAAMMGLTAGPMLVSLNPLAGGLLIPKIGYLFVRFLGLIPFPVLAGVLVTTCWNLGGARRFALAAIPALLVLLRLPALVSFLSTAPREVTPESWRAGFALVEAHVPSGGTVLTDPVTSYALPAYTGRRVVTALDQHSSPSDSTILARSDAVVRALSPYRPIGEAVDACARYGATVVLLNPHRGGRIETFFDVRDPETYAPTRARFENAAMFRLLDEREGFALYALESEPTDALRAETYFPGRELRTESRGGVELSPSVELVRFAITPDSVSPGDTLDVSVVLRKRAPDRPATPYRLVLRLRQTLEGERARFTPVDRLYARVLREGGGPRLELAVNRRPLNGRYPLGIWDPGETIADTFRVRVPRDLEPGVYGVGVRVKPQRLIRNIALRDWLRPSGGIGYPVGEVIVRR